MDIEAADAAIDINNTSTDPLIHFQVSGTTNFTIGTDVTDSKFKIGTTALETGTAVTVQSNGNVGIGTATPGGKLHVYGDVSEVTASQLLLRVEDKVAANEWTGIGLGGYNANTSKTAIIHERTAGYGVGSLHLCVNNTASTADVSKSDAKLTIRSDGNVGIGTSAPVGLLDIEGSNTDGEIILQLGLARRWDFKQAGTGASSILTLEPETDSKYFKIVSQDGTDLATFYAHNTDITQRVILLPDGGRVGIGTTAPGYTLDVSGTINHSGAITNVSDERYKKDINKIDNALGLIAQFDGYNYKFRKDEFPELKFDTTAQIGFIAQEIQKALPQLVSENDSGYLSVNYIKVVPILLMGMKEQQAIIEAQKKEIATEKAENESQKQEIKTIKAEASINTIETAQKLAALEAKLNALLLLNSKGTVIIAEN